MAFMLTPTLNRSYKLDLVNKIKHFILLLGTNGLYSYA